MMAAVQDRVPENEDTTARTAETTEEPGGPALRDAAAVFQRIAADEAAASAARLAYASEGLPRLEADPVIAAELRNDETVHAMREGALMNRLDGNALPGYAGKLYLTSARLVHIGQAVFSLTLPSLDEISIVGERLLLTLASGEGVSFDVAQPRLLRVQIGTARKAVRA
jgi:hypothetical protein